MIPAIEVRGLRKSFGDHEVLKGVDLVVEAGEVVCVIGPSGSGKSTLLRCVNRLEEPSGGTIVIEGEDITDEDCELDDIRRRIGMVFQQFNLFPHLTVLANLTIGQRRVLGRTRVEATETARRMLAARGPEREGGGLPGAALRWPTAAGGDRQSALRWTRT